MNPCFINACGSSTPLQLSIGGLGTDETGVRFLHQPFAIIGRDQRADIVLSHKLVSRRHVYMQIIDGHTFWLDLDSRSGTWSDGQPQKSGWLTAGKIIRIARFEIQQVTGKELARHSPDPTTSSRVSPFLARFYEAQSLPAITLEFLNGPSQATCWPMNRVMSLIGSAEGNKFRLADPSVSPFHCSLLRTPLGLWAVDLLSLDGVFVNDIPVRATMLADGDVLRIGRYRIRIKSRFASTASKSSTHPRPLRNYAESISSHNDSMIVAMSSRLGPVQTDFHMPGQASWNSAASSPSKPGPSSGEVTKLICSKLESTGPLILQDEQVVESVLLPLVSHFGVMQQQMLDQFQQTVSMLVQMFGSLHQDQMSVIREELDQLRGINKEFHELKRELLLRSESQVVSQNIMSPQTRSGHSMDRILEHVENQAGSENGSVATSWTDLSKTANSVDLASSLRSSEQEAFRSAENHRALERQVNSAANNVSTTTRASTPQTSMTNSDRDSNRDIIFWLHDRMASIQQERETRWQKILKLLPGIS